MGKRTQKLLVYLDQNFLSNMSKADVNEKVRPEFKEIYELLHQGFVDESLGCRVRCCATLNLASQRTSRIASSVISTTWGRCVCIARTKSGTPKPLRRSTASWAVPLMTRSDPKARFWTTPISV